MIKKIFTIEGSGWLWLAHLLFLGAASLWLVKGFIGALTWAIVLFAAFEPLMSRCNRRGMPHSMSAILISSLTMVSVFFPVIWFAGELGDRLYGLSIFMNQVMAEKMDFPPWLSWLPLPHEWMEKTWNVLVGPHGKLVEWFGNVGAAGFIASGAEAARKTALTVGDLLVAVIILFFLMQHLQTLRRRSKVWMARMTGKEKFPVLWGAIISAGDAIRGTFFLAVVEGSIFTGLYVMGGLGSAVVWGLATGLVAAIPVAAPLMVVAVSCMVAATGNAHMAFPVFSAGMIVMLFIDPVLRPFFMGKPDRRPPFLCSFLGVIGGIESMGFPGLFIGPAIAAAAWTTLKMEMDNARRKRVSHEDNMIES